MILPDANLLIYAHQPTSPFHSASKRWLEESLSATELFGIPILSIYAFIRFLTNSTIHPKPVPYARTVAIVNDWLEAPNARIVYPGERHWSLVQEISKSVRVSGALLTDVAIAAIAVEYGAVVHTHDRDFARFAGLRWHDPLA